MSMGGAFGALGGDISAISVNPGGLGVFRSSEIMFSPGLTYDQTNTHYISNSTEDNIYQFGLNSLGFVASYDLENSDTRWVNANFSVAYNKMNDFNSNAIMRDENVFSLLEEYVYSANNNEWSPFYHELFWQSFIIDTVANYPLPTEYRSYITDTINYDPAAFSINQQKTLRTEGSTGEVVVAFGANYAHKLYVGASIGIYRLDYKEYSSHYEYENANTMDINNFDYFQLNEISKTTGTGFSLKVGAIYKPIDFLRIGFSYHLPTFYNLQETFYTSIEEPVFGKTSSDKNKYSYKLTTPPKLNASIGFQIAKIALIDVDYEFVNYSNMKLDDDDNSPDVVNDNEAIKNLYKKTHNFRAGAEVRFNSIYLRGGFKYNTSQFTDVTLNSDNDYYSISGGIGYRQKNFYLDFGMQQLSMDKYYGVLSGNPDIDIASINQTKNNFALTFGVKF